MQILCGLFGKSRHAYYEAQWQQKQETLEEAIILELVYELRLTMPLLGTRKLYHMIQEEMHRHCIKLGRDKFFELLSAHGLLLRRRRRKAQTTNSRHWLKKHPNLIRFIEVTRAHELWVSDITYIAVADRFSYLSLITDAYSRKIIGYHLSQALVSYGTLEALKMAIGANWQPGSQLIHHSDRGVQYCSSEYIDILQRHSILISMTEKSDPYENALAERINGILKSEFGLSRTFVSHEEAEREVSASIEIYNTMRPHGSCDYRTPAEAHSGQGVLRRRWKNYYKGRPKSTATEEKELSLECKENSGIVESL